METEIRNTVFHWARAQVSFTIFTTITRLFYYRINSVYSFFQGPLQPKPEARSPDVDLNYLKKAQIQWERRIQKSLNSMCNELNVPLARIRPNADREELAEKWNELSTYDVGKLKKMVLIN